MKFYDFKFYSKPHEKSLIKASLVSEIRSIMKLLLVIGLIASIFALSLTQMPSSWSCPQNCTPDASNFTFDKVVDFELSEAQIIN